MSGICGVISLEGRPVAGLAAEQMAAAAMHRGVGGSVVWAAQDGAAVQQWRRLPRGQQVGRLPADDVVVVADARLDNVEELHHALTRSGHLRPSGGRDDQALLRAAFAAWGEDFAARLVGDFAIVVWDRRRRMVLAARDPMAMRSLYYRREPSGRLLFGTEVKQILAAPGVPAEIDESVVAADLIGNFGRPDRSFFVGIEQLPPGMTLVSRLEGQVLRRFWEIDPAYRVGCSSFDEAAEELRRVFVQAVAARLDPESPTGILLSGGVDSGSVASAAGWLREHDPAVTPSLRSYSWQFSQLPDCDERHISRHVVDRYGVTSTDVPADDAGPLACYPEHGPDLDDPFLGGFQPLIEHALELARRDGVGVLLGGDRGDLVIGDTGLSYVHMVRARRWRRLRTALREHRSASGESWAAVARHDVVRPLGQHAQERSAVQWATWGLSRARRARQGPGGDSLPHWLRPDFLRRVDLDAARAPEPVPEGLDPARELRYRLIFTPMHLRGMAWSERTYARHGLGFADPFSDRRLVELVLALPAVWINRPGDRTKPLMRAAVRGLMPEAARLGAGKIVPQPLFDSGLRRRADLVMDLLATPLIEDRGWVDAAALRRHYQEWLGGGDLAPEFWWVMQVETWLRAREAARG